MANMQNMNKDTALRLADEPAGQATAVPENIRGILARCRDFIDTTKAPAYPAGADLADEIDVLLAAQAAPTYKDSTPELHIGDSAFESWYSTYSPAHKSDKQRARDAYAAGMGDPLVTAAPAAVAGPSGYGPKVTVKRRCSDCKACNSESYAVQGDSGHYVYCEHPSLPESKYIGDTNWNTPHWCPVSAPTTQPASQREPAEIDTATMVLAESVGLIGPASRTHDLHGAIQRFHDLICANATIKAAQMAAEAISAAAPQPAPAAEWQDISTAPKDGRTLLLGYFNSAGNWRTLRGRWVSEDYISAFWKEPENGEPGWYECAVEADNEPNCWATDPTHWMPLPSPPARKG